jgi:hypothetical protein
MPTRNVVVSRVREARRAHTPRLTRSDLAARLQTAGLSLDRGAVSEIEIGYREVREFEVVALAKALNVTTSWLVDSS